MPHTTRRKKQNISKRVEIVDDEGWTRVTSTHALRKGITRSKAHVGLVHGTTITEAEQGSTVETVTRAYKHIESQWLASESCRALVVLLENEALTADACIESCFIFGSGSFCGLRQGWIKRDTAALCQLAIFKTLQTTIGRITGTIPVAYAQDPAYNDIDRDFLKSCQIETAETPRGFELLGEKSLAYTPCAEMHVDMHVLKQTPSLLLSGKLDWYWRNAKGKACTNRIAVQCSGDGLQKEEEADVADPSGSSAKQLHLDKQEDECQAFEAFLEARQEARLPDLDIKDDPFTNQHLYWLDQTSRHC